MKLGSFLTKMNKVFDSCNDLKQLDMAKKYCEMYAEKTKESFYILERIINEKIYKAHKRIHEEQNG
jgi:hypothetical protein